MKPAGEREAARARVAAAAAARGLGALLERAVAAQASERAFAAGELNAGLRLSDEWTAAVFADLSGAVEGEAAIVLARETLAEAFECLLGERPKRVLPERAAAALYELGNIAMSGAASALARLENGRVMPSVPRVVHERSSHERSSVGAGDRRVAWCVEVALEHRERLLRLRFVWIPKDR